MLVCVTRADAAPTCRRRPVLILIFIVIVGLAAFAGYYAGALRRVPPPSAPPVPTPVAVATPLAPASPPPVDEEQARVGSEKARLIRSLSGETFALRAKLDLEGAASEDLARARAGLSELDVAIIAAREETARFRQLVVDIENNAPPPILLGSNEPDDLKLIVGIGPVLERILHNLGIGTFRQIARWTERDIAEFDAKLPEFPGRIARDQWVTQARALQESKYGASPLRRSP
jgi:predicted flap endonuclease-1-like 5' DNA nuclease